MSIGEVVKDFNVEIKIPNATADPEYLERSKPVTVMTWLIAREIFLAAVENLINLEDKDRETSHP